MDKIEFQERIMEIKEKHKGDHEVVHYETDDLMENLLIELGYSDGIAAIRKLTRWCA